MLVLDDIGKLWDNVEFNEDNFLQRLNIFGFINYSYIKRLEYYYSYFNKLKFFNGEVFITD